MPCGSFHRLGDARACADLTHSTAISDACTGRNRIARRCFATINLHRRAQCPYSTVCREAPRPRNYLPARPPPLVTGMRALGQGTFTHSAWKSALSVARAHRTIHSSERLTRFCCVGSRQVVRSESNPFAFRAICFVSLLAVACFTCHASSRSSRFYAHTNTHTLVLSAHLVHLGFFRSCAHLDTVTVMRRIAGIVVLLNACELKCVVSACYTILSMAQSCLLVVIDGFLHILSRLWMLVWFARCFIELPHVIRLIPFSPLFSLLAIFFHSLNALAQYAFFDSASLARKSLL